MRNIRSYMSAHVLLNFLNELENCDNMLVLFEMPEILWAVVLKFGKNFIFRSEIVNF